MGRGAMRGGRGLITLPDLKTFDKIQETNIYTHTRPFLYEIRLVYIGIYKS